MGKKKSCPECLGLVSEKTRAKIIRQLRQKPKNVSKILVNFALTQPTITHHLKLLEKMKIVFSKKQGREIYYFLNKKYPCKKCFLFKIPLLK